MGRGVCRGTRRLVVAAGVVLVLFSAAPRASAQAFFPDIAPSGPTFQDDFESGLTYWYQFPTTGQWSDGTGSGSCFSSNYLRDESSQGPTIAAIRKSMPGNPGYNPADWENIRVEFDFQATGPSAGQMGVAWGLQPDGSAGAGTDGYPDAGYVFYIDNFADASGSPGPGNRARWHLIRRTDDVNKMLDEGDVVLSEGSAGLDSVYLGSCYRLRLEFFCGGLRIQIRDDSVGSSWFSVFEWTDPIDPLLTPGGVGVYLNAPEPGSDRYRFDNVDVYSWGSVCGLYCSAWDASSWSQFSTEAVPMKRLYEGVLHDFWLARGDSNAARIDDNVTLLSDQSLFPPGMECGYNQDLDHQWSLLVDLPSPTAATGNVNEVLNYLEPVSTAVSASDMFTFSPNFDSTNPIPMVASQPTPINNTLQAAYNWYSLNRSSGGAWDNLHDPAAACRLWYVVFITDGGESCQSYMNGGYASACDWLQDSAANSFAHPATGLSSVPVFAVGFGAGAQADFSQLQCIANETGGVAYTASNAADLANILYDVVNTVIEANRSFLPVTVAPPPNTYGSGQSSDFLLTVPMFVPKKTASVWDGHLYGFEINPDNPTPPLYTSATAPTPDLIGQIDASQAVWDGADALKTQLTDGTGRNVYYGRDVSGTFTRTDLSSIKSSSTLRDQFKIWLDWPGGVTDSEADQIVDFIDLTATHTNRPLGDIYHSAPVIVGPPNDFTYVLQNVHNYGADFASVHQYRRRVALAGANDGQLHAFDAGFYNRDTTNYPNVYDLGTGTELFSYVPNAVMNRLYSMTFGTEQQYMVDGPIATADVYIDEGSGTRSWHTVAVTGMRRGGRGLVALDITQPDPYSSGVPSPSDVLPGCSDGSAVGCNGQYPKPLWEFNAANDTDENGDLQPDLGWTWSTPVIARVKKDIGGTNPDDMYVAFFGGGWDRDGTGTIGTFLYGLDVETGNIIYKQNIGAAVPGGMTALDVDDDGWIDRIYFGDTNGGLWRLDLTADATFSGGRVSNWTLTKIYEFGPVSVTLPDGTTATKPLEFYQRPTLVPAAFAGGSYIWGLAIGTGDRANVGAEDQVENRFYFVLDDTTRTGGPFTEAAADGLTPITLGSGNSGQNLVDPANGKYGWYLVLRPNEKVNADAIVANQIVQFPTFEPTGVVATPGATPTPPTGGTPAPVAPNCHAVGTGRLYQVYFNNGDPTGGERGTDLGEGFISGGTDYTIGDETRSWWTTWENKGIETVLGTYRFHRVTNWRQD